jgi:hypothetical protein
MFFQSRIGGFDAILSKNTRHGKVRLNRKQGKARLCLCSMKRSCGIDSVADTRGWWNVEVMISQLDLENMSER